MSEFLRKKKWVRLKKMWDTTAWAKAQSRPQVGHGEKEDGLRPEKENVCVFWGVGGVVSYD